MERSQVPRNPRNHRNHRPKVHLPRNATELLDDLCQLSVARTVARLVSGSGYASRGPEQPEASVPKGREVLKQTETNTKVRKTREFWCLVSLACTRVEITSGGVPEGC